MPKTILDDRTSQWAINDSNWIWTLRNSASISVNGVAIIEDVAESNNYIFIEGDIHSDTLQEGSTALSSAGTLTRIDVATTSLIDTETGFAFTGIVPRLSNSGLIHVTGTAILQSGIGSVYVDNEGEITGTEALDVAWVSMINREQGLIHGNEVGIRIANTTPGALSTIENHGIISGDESAIIDGSDSLKLTNYGRILGDIDLGGATDSATFYASSRVVGHFDAGNEADKIFIRSGAEFSEAVEGGNGNDLYRYNDDSTMSQVTTLAGGADDDVYRLIGSGTHVQITETSSAGNDLVSANFDYVLPDNVEELTVYGNADLKGTGNSADNVIRGRSDLAVLSGLKGNDVLLISRGQDGSLIGGEGNDVFVFTDQQNTVIDFVQGEDTIAFARKSGIKSFDQVKMEQHGDDVWLGVQDGSGFQLRAVVENIDGTTLQSSDFQFHFHF